MPPKIKKAKEDKNSIYNEPENKNKNMEIIEKFEKLETSMKRIQIVENILKDDDSFDYHSYFKTFSKEKKYNFIFHKIIV